MLVHVIEGYVMEESKLDETFMKRLGADSQMTGNLPHWNQGTTRFIMLRLSFFTSTRESIEVKLQGDTSRSSKPIVDISLKLA